MQNFSYCNPTRLHFGRGAENDIGRLALDVLGHDGKILLIYGGGFVKRSGLLERVRHNLEDSGLTVIEKGGVAPNPRLSFVRETVDWVSDQGVGLVIGLGGGSVIDTAKLVALGLEYDGDAWDFFDREVKPQKVLPVIAVQTLPGSGSEQSPYCVISHHGTKAQICMDEIRPAVAIINPELFASLPKHQIAAGIASMMAHVLECYFGDAEGSAYSDAQAVAALKIIMAYGQKVYENSGDYDSWCQIAMVATNSRNGMFGLGRIEDNACMAIEHELSGWNDAIAEGMGLSVVIPAWMRYVSQTVPERFVEFSVNVMDVNPQKKDEMTITLGIAKLCAFFQILGLPISMHELGASDCPVESLAKHCCRNGLVGSLVKLDAKDVIAVLATA